MQVFITVKNEKTIVHKDNSSITWWELRTHVVMSVSWRIYITGCQLRFGIQSKWLHSNMKNISHCTDGDPYSLFLYRTGIQV